MVWGVAACSSGAQEPADARTTAPAPVEPAPTPQPWRYGPALAASIPQGLAVVPVLEWAHGHRGRARIVVAVAEADVPARLEVWDFSQHNERGLLERDLDPVRLLDLADATPVLDPEILAGLRRDLATPGSERVRPLGLVGSPAAVLADLQRAAQACFDGDATSRTAALATVVRGLDDGIAFETARLPELILRLRHGTWQVGVATQISERRVAVAVQADQQPLRVELSRTQDRWAVRSVEVVEPQSASAAPAAEPSPTAP